LRQALPFGCTFVLLFSLTGCGSSPDGLVKDQIKAMNDMADALEKNEPETKVAEIKKRLEENNKKLEELKLSDEEKKKLIEKHKDELTRATTRLQQAMLTKAMKDMGGKFKGIPGFGDPP
jgi:TolA-binding protein